ncbi:hypothetical protein LPN04_29720 [Rugamonas sp. A1-17]|nr:hypothetical protein [Rugamonas sp. A1-17]
MKLVYREVVRRWMWGQQLVTKITMPTAAGIQRSIVIARNTHRGRKQCTAAVMSNGSPIDATGGNFSISVMNAVMTAMQ